MGFGNGGSGLSIKELHRAMPRLGFTKIRTNAGNHVCYQHENGRRVSITAPHGKAGVSKPLLRSIGGVIGCSAKEAEARLRQRRNR
jgi:predicted RNA binding protein YcfA (HicA-like mRNA interferase family)